ncbi:asparagine synthase (glutamine-hydrolyzing) [Pseudotabrizicola sp.]|uniref:asparagine synthase (glutamine-hydrolyzing) n=1 Tax=Pseudotabrizicola sp. TaxID=2939647 RepID=UPI002726D99C|nr:asparagine synthase (glutamine-hydrolyzing) [Pseudotabrizicola sp.]MDO8883844.1 asparagine synthase (glutamine-hydrolyzing) [Pseudotabrizicola sp.]
MCGLFGEIGPRVLQDQTAIANISRSIVHRGPDAEGVASGDDWLLGFRRLAILDLSAEGNQPMRSDDGNHILVFNGEVYNYLELRAALEAKGERFRSGTDTEVVMRLLMREGASALARLNGMFAFVYLDLSQRRYLIARDRFGKKPLYVTVGGATLRFASELRALLQWPQAARDIDPDAVTEFLALGYVPGERCIFKGYAKLPPGHFLRGDLDKPNTTAHRWWTLDIAPDASLSGQQDALLEELDALLADATNIRMRSDVPVALLLSGGIDSGLVASYMNWSGAATLGLVAAFDQAEYDESDLARQTAQHLGMQIKILPLQDSNLSDVDLVARHYDEPFGDPSALPMLHICEAARAHATVLMTGDGGDEAFGGYRRYVQAQKFKAGMAIPDAVKRLVWSVAKNRLAPKQAYRLAKATLPGELLGAVFDGLGLARDPALSQLIPKTNLGMTDVVNSVRKDWNKSQGKDLLTRQRLFDYAHYLPDDVLVKVDRASMAQSTEARSPFLDYRVAELAAKLPKDMLLRHGQGKWMLRELAKKRLPPDVVKGGKRGFGVPVGEWIRKPSGTAMVQERLIDRAANPSQLWESDGVATLLADHLDGKRNYGEQFWRLLVLESWLRQHGGMT